MTLTRELIAEPVEKVQINDLVHGQIGIIDPVSIILNTPEFQRLKEIQQLGLTHLVYPTADHSRYSHSLGVYHLSNKMMQILRTKGYLITIADYVSVCIAGLFHDIGHCAFSHTFEKTPFSTMKHEKRSILITKLIMKRDYIKAYLEKYLGEGDDYEREVTFICELIGGDSRFDKDSKWLMKGRPMSKGYLYQIVSNNEDGHDVDKFDYLLRDRLLCNLDTPFGKNALERIMNHTRVMENPRIPGHYCLCREEKLTSELRSVTQSRSILHENAYQHETTIVFEHMILEVLTKAAPHLYYPDSKGQMFPLSKIDDSIEAFTKVTDSLQREIRNSTVPELEESRKILELIDARNQPRRITREIKMTERELKELANNASLSGESSKIDLIKKKLFYSLRQRDIKNIYNRTQECDIEYIEKNLIVLIRDPNKSLKFKVSPIENVLFYKGDGNKAFFYDDAKLERIYSPSRTFGICFYFRNTINEEAEFCESLGEAIAKCFNEDANCVRRQKRSHREVSQTIHEQNNNERKRGNFEVTPVE